MNCTNVSCTTNQTCSVESQPASITVLICLFLMVGFLLNIFSLWVFKYRTPEWKSGTVLQFHLAISDLILCPLGPFLAVNFTLGYWPFGHLMCQLKIALLFIHFYSSIFFLSLISIHRYVSVVYHSQEFQMKQKDFVKKLCVGVWAFILINGVVYCLLLGASKDEKHVLCYSIHQKDYKEKYFALNFVLLIPGFLIPFMISVVCYSRLARSVSSINVCHLKGRQMKSKSRKMIAVCLLIFVVCFSPYHVIQSVMVVVNKFYPEHCHLLLQLETLYYASWILFTANCYLDPLIYCFASQNFMAAFRSSMRKIGVRFQSTHENIDHDSPQTTYVTPTPRMIKRKNMSMTHL
ncbi:cysteinyl leukotriene receptor 2-like [Tachysurus ichikawai]